MSTKTDERPNAREREQRLGFVSRPRFEDYQEKYATYFNMERRNGILQVQMHTEGRTRHLRPADSQRLVPAVARHRQRPRQRGADL